MPIVANADFAPDQAPYLSPNNPVASGTYPRSDNADGPLKGPAPYTVSLPGACRGAVSARDKLGNSYVVAGTATGLYLLSGGVWVSKGTGYSVPASGHWQFTQFGERLIATNGVDPVLTWTLGDAANFATLSAGAPRAVYVATIEPGFVMLGYYNTVGGGLWWSGINDATLWPVPGTLAATSVQSDNQELPGGGFITGILPAIGGGGGAIFTERAIYRVDYVGAPAIFSFREVDRSRGCICPMGLAQVGAVAFFIAEDGFYTFDGSAVTGIGFGKVDRFFKDSVDAAQLHRVYATVDFDRKLIIWAWPTAGAANPNRWLVFNYGTGRWRFGDDPGLAVAYLFPARTPAITLDDPDTFPDNLDTPGAPPLDSPLYSGGRRLLAGFDAAARLVTFDGPTLPARIETGDTDASGRRVFVSGIRPLSDTRAAMAMVGTREELGDNIAYSTPTALGADGRCPQRVSGRYARAVTQIPGGAAWTYHQGVDVAFRAEGRR